jgi:ribonuclease HII
MGESLAKWYEPSVVEAGCDEAGRGCLAGPVVAAAVILPAHFEHPWLNDSKALSEKQRNTLRPIIEAEALAWGVGICSVEEIDQMNILKASFVAMHKAIRKLSVQPESLLIDGNRFIAYPDIPHHCMVKGDARFRSIAAASILAKTHRDALMLELDGQFPAYQWKQNKGYPTKAHREAIRAVGPSPHHRKSFRLLPQQGKLF